MIIINKVILVGRLTKDPEVRYTQNGKAIATFTLAVDRFTGQGQKEADFIPIVVWGKVAEVCADHLIKGQKVLTDGRLQVRSYDDKSGQKRWVTEVIAQSVEFLEKKEQPNYENQGSYGPEIFPDDQVPF